MVCMICGQSLREFAAGARLMSVSRNGRQTSTLASSKERCDYPLRAKSVSLAERPRSQYARNVRSAESNRHRYAEKHFFNRTLSSNDKKTHYKPNNVVVKKQNRKAVEKVPFAVSVQNLSIPMTYADNPRNSTSKPHNLYNSNSRIDNRNKPSNPKQVSDKRLCQTVGRKETENKLLLQISEAEQVSDFERILNSNAILWERAQGHVWRGSVAAQTPSASFLPRPRSSYSLRAVSQAYHYLFQQHEESLQPLIDRYRQENAEEPSNPTESLLENNWYDNLQDLSEFYDDDVALQREIETITDRIVAEEVKATDGEKSNRCKNFNVNLTSLLSLHVNGEGVSPTSPYRDELPPSPEIDKIEAYDDTEWLDPIMSSNSNDRHHTQNNSDLGVNCLVQNLNKVQIDSNEKVPAITFSNCCEGRANSDTPNNTDAVIHLAVPSIETVNEARPPMM